MTLRLGTRASLLATTQSQTVADQIFRATGEEVVLVPITSEGDVLTGSLAQMGGTGVFATALRDALLRGECDLLVHSMKDLPTAPFPGITVQAVPVRASSADVLCDREGRTLAALPAGARIGTGSPRRAAQVLAVRADLEVSDIRGNVDNRLGKVDAGQYDAIILAEAGVSRIGRRERISDVMSWPGSAAQGALAVEIRTGDVDGAIGSAVRSIEDADARITSGVERAVLARLEAGCAAPIGVSATVSGDAVSLVAIVYALDGSREAGTEHVLARGEVDTEAGRTAVAAAVVDELFAAGAASLAELGGAQA